MEIHPREGSAARRAGWGGHESFYLKVCGARESHSRVAGSLRKCARKLPRKLRTIQIRNSHRNRFRFHNYASQWAAQTLPRARARAKSFYTSSRSPRLLTRAPPRRSHGGHQRKKGNPTMKAHLEERPHLFTSESVADGHPDKVADHISDSILDDIIRQDRNCRVAVETLVSTGMAIVAGEITTTAFCDFVAVVRNTIREIGYDDPSTGFDWQSVAVLSSIKPQSPDIAQGVNRKKKEEQGAGDQGLMFGFACDQTPTMMPAPIYYAHRVTERLGEVRRKGTLDYLYPDGKSQVTIEYKHGAPARLDAAVVAAMHKD